MKIADRFSTLEMREFQNDNYRQEVLYDALNDIARTIFFE